jgi:hypothetical protein
MQDCPVITKRILSPLLALSLALAASLGCPAAFSAQSDWEEDERPHTIVNPNQFSDAPPPTAPPIVKPSGGKPMLQGNATTFGAAPMASRMLVPGRVSGNARLDQEANRILMNAQTNVAVPPQQFRAWLEKTYPDFALNGQASPGEVLEIKGQWDDSSKTLRALGIRHESFKAKVLCTANLAPVKVMIVNCEGRIPRDAVQAIRDWVARGGYLVSTDWTLHNLVEKAFPGYIMWNGGETDGSIVDARVVEEDPVLLQGLDNIRVSTWKLDRESQMVRVIKPQAVRVLARSVHLARRDNNTRFPVNGFVEPNLTGILACEFQFGRGRVLHLVGHYDNNAATFRPNVLPDPAPGIGISLRQAMTTNFIMQALKQKHTASALPLQ